MVEAKYMVRALQLAKLGQYSTSPNPRVGCVIVKNGVIVGEGFHKLAGSEHAEINALNQAGNNAQNSTVYVTLEPCCYVGKTNACTDALIRAGVSKVVVAMLDPNPKVAGKGLEILKQANIKTSCGLLQQQATALNRGFIKRMQHNLPYVTLKTAMSLDGKTAMQNGQSMWITSSFARKQVQLLRAKSCAIISSSNTIIKDNARLSVRIDELNDLPNEQLDLVKSRMPFRVAIDSKLRIDLDANFYQIPRALVASCLTHANTSAKQNKLRQISNLGHKVWLFEGAQVDLLKLLQRLADLGCNEVLVEAGSKLGGAFVAANLVDEYKIFIATKLLGGSAKSMFDLPINNLSDAYNLQISDIKFCAKDLQITAYPLYL